MSKKSPQLRFEGFTDDWEERKFGEVWKKSSERNLNLEYSPKQVLSVAQMKLNPSNRNEQDDYMKTYNVLHKGDIAFEGNKSKSFAFGRFVLNDLQDGIVSHVFNVYRPICKMDTDFMKVYINNESVMKYLLVKATTKTLMMTTLNTKDIVKQKLNLPSLEEQQKIGSFFKQLDKTIALHQRKLDLLKEQKKGYLQKMFPKNGAKVPELRFAGFADDWEERKFKDILKTHSFRSYLAGVSENGEYEVIQQGDKPIVGYSDGEPFTDYKDITLFGDHTVSLYKPKSPFFVATDGVKILSADNFDGDYLYTTLERYKPEPQGYKRHFTILKNQDVWFTENMEEQQKIGSFFKQLDDTIALHQRKLDLLKEQKKGFLQKMFV